MSPYPAVGVMGLDCVLDMNENGYDIFVIEVRDWCFRQHECEWCFLSVIYKFYRLTYHNMPDQS